MPTALYRRYRPDTFAEVIGQEHVTEPLMQALTSGRINHAYLFSGPRGCGKTTSARILARCLNCEQGPTPTPCGVCESCTGLARGGPGTLDVVEIDAASHGGVDDARELRERATMSAARDRFKIYIIDEAHMVSNQGFNALLKVVEEPPPHVMFIFATTEPDKVLQTIRSRTHHYPFHLVPPATLTEYLARLCDEESIHVEPRVLPLVVRAGGGSVRDSLSVLDQLMAGADSGGVDYARATALLGYTDSALLDDVVGAVDAVDGATLFTVVDRVISSGHDPRRFVEDLLERLRDLIIVQALGDRSAGVLRALPPDQLERMAQQAAALGAASLSRAADIVNDGLVDMVGASSPRMHLELLCARLLLPGVEAGPRGLGARVDRIERRLGVPGAPPPAGLRAAPAEPEPEQTRLAPAPAVPEDDAAPAPTAADGSERGPWVVPALATAAGPPPAPEAATPEIPSPATDPDPVRTSPPAPAADEAPPAPAPAPAPSTAAGAIDTAAVRRSWVTVLDAVQQRSRFTAMLLGEAHVLDFADDVLRLGFTNLGAGRNFSTAKHLDVVRQALADVLGVAARVEAVPMNQPADDAAAAVRPDAPDPRGDPPSAPSDGVAPEAAPSGPAAPEPPAEPAGQVPEPPPDQTGPAERSRSGVPWPAPRQVGGDGDASLPPPPETLTPPGGRTAPTPEPELAVQHWPEPAVVPGTPVSTPAPEPEDDAPAGANRERPSARSAGSATAATSERPPGTPPASSGRRPAAPPHVAPEDDEAHRDDVDADDSGLVGRPVIEQLLGGRVIDEEHR